MPVDECIQIGVALTTALEHLHSHGLVHRDVKPSNIIFIGGVPKLADIGLVASMDATMSFVGTSGFLPPEGPGTPQGDIYSLGKVLYEISMGRDRQEFPKLPSNLAEVEDSARLLELNAVILKACHHDPRQRYQSAEAMRADLERLCGGKSVRRAHQVEASVATGPTRGGMAGGRGGGFDIDRLGHLVWQPPANPEFSKRSTNLFANDKYDAGRVHYLMNSEPEIAKAAEYFQIAVNADTNFALAQAALAVSLCWSFGGTNANWELLPQAKQIAERALAKDDTLSEAHLALAAHAWIKEWDWLNAEKHYQTAVKCDPKNPQPHEWYGFFLFTCMGRTNEAIRELEAAVNLKPHSQTATRFLGDALFAARRYSEAVGRFEKAVEIDPSAMHHRLLSQALWWDGQIDRSLEESARAAELDGEDPATVAARMAELKRIFHEEGAAAFWRKQLEIRRGETRILDLAEACAAAGRTEEALDLLERAYASTTSSWSGI